MLKSKGNVDEKSADPITFTLFRLILKWALDEGNIFVWVWTILQWNLMARSISIDPLALHNFSVSEDHFNVRHDSTKTDKEGARTHNKAVYCNPLDPLVCTGVCLGVWLCIQQRSFVNNQEKIFLRRGAKAGSAAHRYCDQLMTLVKRHWDVVQTHIQTMSAHGVRKGSATHVASATTSPPPLPSIASRGDWSLGKVLDIYWQFAEAGDAYLGRCLSGLDPNDSNFSVLPPHWTVESPLDDDDIAAGLKLMYGEVIRHHPRSMALLVRLLAAVTYSSDWLMDFTIANRGHPFSAIPLLQNPDLLRRLKAKVTIEPTESMRTPTGVPPHVKQLNLMTTLLKLCQTTLEKVNDQAETVRLSIFDALENRALENGTITRNHIFEVLEEFRNKISDDVGRQIQILRDEGIGHHPRDTAQGGQAVVGTSAAQQGTLFSFQGKFWDVPEDFLFPAGLKRDAGWRLWLLGMPAFMMRGENGELEQRAIKPFRKLIPSRLPKKIANAYKLHWRPVYKMMEQGLTQPVPQSCTVDEVNSLFEQGTTYMKTRVSYIFDNSKFHHIEWTLATWSHYIGRSQIMKHGTENDKLNLPEQHRNNRPHNPGRKRRVPPPGKCRRSVVQRRGIADDGLAPAVC